MHTLPSEDEEQGQVGSLSEWESWVDDYAALSLHSLPSEEEVETLGILYPHFDLQNHLGMLVSFEYDGVLSGMIRAHHSAGRLESCEIFGHDHPRHHIFR